MIVIVQVRRPLCWSCKQVGHLARSCPQKAVASNKTTTINTTTTTTNNNNNNNINKNQEKAKNTLEPGNYPNNPEEGWTQVTRKKKSPAKAKTTTKESLPAPVQPEVPAAETTRAKTIAKALTEATTEETTTTTEAIATHPVPSPTKKNEKKGKKKNTEGEQP